jgi:hypothetical protein
MAGYAGFSVEFEDFNILLYPLVEILNSEVWQPGNYRARWTPFLGSKFH